MRVKTALALGAALSIFGLAVPAYADTLALTFTGGQVPAPDANAIHISATGGWSFTVSSAITVTALGLWDEGADGLGTSHTVAVWDSTGNELFSANLSGSGTMTVAGDADGQWDLTNALLSSGFGATVLGPGTYTIGGFYSASVGQGETYDAVRSQATSAMASGLTFGGAEFAGGFADPITPRPAGDDGFFGPNFEFIAGGVTTPAPEPATWLLMIAAFAGLGFAARRNRGQARRSSV